MISTFLLFLLIVIVFFLVIYLMFHPLILIPTILLVMYIASEYFLVERRVIGMLNASASNGMTLNSILADLGYRVSNEEDCFFISCVVYDTLNELRAKGDVFMVPDSLPIHPGTRFFTLGK